MRSPIVYQIYPKSFKDTNGDGLGDINGVTEKLDYIKSLGVDMIWLTPIFKSPQNDNGYDVADYTAIDPLFGTMDDVTRLIDEASKRGLGIMFDMVLNHTSTEHEWFKKALSGQKEYQDYYFFRDKPTNWESKFGGNAWKYVEELNLYYLHLFDVTQADLDWENPKVFEELVRIVNFWLDKGIKGLRFDVINLISKPKVFEDDAYGDGRRYYTDGPNAHTFLQALNKATFGKYQDVLTVGELSSTSIEEGTAYANPANHELGTVFGFHHLKVDYKDGNKWLLKAPDIVAFKSILANWQESMQANNAYMALFASNHDQPRALSRFADAHSYPYESATLVSTTLFLMRGIVYLYQGEEIGLPNAEFKSMASFRDIESLNYNTLNQDTLTQEERLTVLNARSRDNGRTPIPWDSSDHYGFSTHEPWIPFSEHPQLQTVESNEANPRSILNYTRSLLKYRKASETLNEGVITFEALDHPTRFDYTRSLDKEQIRVIGNYSAEIDRVQLDPTWEVVFSNYDVTQVTEVHDFKPYEVLVLRKLSD